MPNCECDFITAGILQDCNNNTAGIKRLWLGRLCDNGIVDSSPAGYKEITSTAAATMFKFEFRKNTSTAGEVLTGDEANGTQFYTQTVTLKLNRREKTKRDKLLLMSRYTDLIAIVEDMNGLFWLYGEENGLVISAMEAPSGTAKTDHNGYMITITGEEQVPASEMTASHIASLLSAGDLDAA